ncbi:MAG: DNA repair protein RadC [Deferribacteres bacterium]|nr:DNA repair protein RadC [candidate division KSB1 bacterium]MCB9501522.1 DNA repair protein RadC [Deferribacteres bacterium]
MEYKTRIADWPEDDRPREKLVTLGADSLSDAELLAIILRVGFQNSSAVDVARHILQQCNGFRGIDKMDVHEMISLKGIGLAKAAQIKAAIAIGKRLATQDSQITDRITSSRDIFNLFHLKYRDLKREKFSVIFLTSRNKIIAEKVLFEGSITESMVSVREVIREVIANGAASVVFLHNHPSGEISPSKSDIDITQKLVSACKTIDVQVLDHIIIGDGVYYSFADDQLI